MECPGFSRRRHLRALCVVALVAGVAALTACGDNDGGSGGDGGDEGDVKAVVERVVEQLKADDPAACDAFTDEAVMRLWEGMYEEGQGRSECVSGLANWGNDTPLDFVNSDYPNDDDWKSVTDIEIDGDYAVAHPVRLDGGSESINLEFKKVDGSGSSMLEALAFSRSFKSAA